MDPDVIDLRYKHYQARLIDTINRIIEQRRQIKIEQARELLRNQQRNPGLNTSQNNSGGSQDVKTTLAASLFVKMVDVKERMNMKGLGSNLKKKGTSPAPGTLPQVTQTPAGEKGGTGTFFLTDTAALSQTPAAKKNFSLSIDKTSARKTSALAGIGGPPDFSPSQMSVSGGVPYNHNLNELIAMERRRAMNQTTKQKEIVALNYAIEK